MYCYILGCGIACLIFTGISSMDTVDVKPVEVAVKTLLWPVALVARLARSSGPSMKMRAAR
ncbi:MAG TPA: hypothetical protein H9996_04070 [Candidatus Faecalibacterium avium]|nr:hypothetical protein B5G12_13365 [Faecalibacterium sp. An58]OUQ34441.1 hypothetical protein B5E66_12220 [Faecalibacterium sp. An121]HIV43366.1 hypothetical protein [Candidatus Faecalibacterium avium]